MEKGATKRLKRKRKKSPAGSAIDPENQVEAIACISGLADEVLRQCPGSSGMLVMLDGRQAKLFYLP